jgi:hypothetical protein
MRSKAPGRILGLGALGLGAEAAAACPHPALGEALVTIQILAAVVIAIVFATALRGSDVTTERLFRLLRWIAGRPEPPPPDPPPCPAPAPGTAARDIPGHDGGKAGAGSSDTASGSQLAVGGWR